MTTTFEPPTPYPDVDLDDAVTRGRLSHAASHGDQRARVTLKAWQRKQAAAAEPANTEAAQAARERVNAGRDLYASRAKSKPKGGANIEPAAGSE